MCSASGGNNLNIETFTGTFVENDFGEINPTDTITVNFSGTFTNIPKIQVSQVLHDAGDSHVNIYVESVTASSVILRTSNQKGTITKFHGYAIGNR
jgi:hypothetical protein